MEDKDRPENGRSFFVLADSVYIYLVRYPGSIISILFAFSGFAQKHRQCEIYQYFGIDSLNKKLVSTQTFNDKGKVIKEVCDGYYESMDPKGSSLTLVKAAGTYRYIYNDTLLVESRWIYWNYTDSFIFHKWYNPKKQLVAEMMMLHRDTVFVTGRNAGRYEVFSGGDTSLYIYDNGKKAARYSPVDSEFYFYDNLNRLIKDSTHYNDASFYYDNQGILVKDNIFCSSRPRFDVVSYHYFVDGYRKDSFSSADGRVAAKEYFTVGSQNRITTYAVYWRNTRGPTAHNGNDYWEHHRISYSYYPTGEIKKEQYFFDDELTTTHEFLYK